MAMIVGGVIRPFASPDGGKNSRCDNWAIDDSRCEGFKVSPGILWSQLVTARCRVLTDGFNGRVAGWTFSFDLGRPQSIKARTVRSCFDAVAKAINRVPAKPLNQLKTYGEIMKTYSYQGISKHELSNHRMRLYFPIQCVTRTIFHYSEAIKLSGDHSSLCKQMLTLNDLDEMVLEPGSEKLHICNLLHLWQQDHVELSINMHLVKRREVAINWRTWRPGGNGAKFNQ